MSHRSTRGSPRVNTASARGGPVLTAPVNLLPEKKVQLLPHVVFFEPEIRGFNEQTKLKIKTSFYYFNYVINI
ncbi:hypothetical protein R6Q59_019906 [Mikania micrantha]